MSTQMATTMASALLLTVAEFQRYPLFDCYGATKTVNLDRDRKLVNAVCIGGNIIL